MEVRNPIPNSSNSLSVQSGDANNFAYFFLNRLYSHRARSGTVMIGTSPSVQLQDRQAVTMSFISKCLLVLAMLTGIK